MQIDELKPPCLYVEGKDVKQPIQPLIPPVNHIFMPMASSNVCGGPEPFSYPTSITPCTDLVKIQESTQHHEEGVQIASALPCTRDNLIKACHSFTKAIECAVGDPLTARSYANRSKVAMDLAWMALARSDAQMCIFLRPDWAKGYLRLVEVHHRDEDKLSAMKTLLQAGLKCKDIDARTKEVMQQLENDVERAIQFDQLLQLNQQQREPELKKEEGPSPTWKSNVEISSLSLPSSSSTASQDHSCDSSIMPTSPSIPRKATNNTKRSVCSVKSEEVPLIIVEAQQERRKEQQANFQKWADKVGAKVIGECHHSKCPRQLKRILDTSDFYILECSAMCKIFYHQQCWRSEQHLTPEANAPCWSPDCAGLLIAAEFFSDSKKVRSFFTRVDPTKAIRSESVSPSGPSTAPCEIITPLESQSESAPKNNDSSNSLPPKTSSRPTRWEDKAALWSPLTRAQRHAMREKAKKKEKRRQTKLQLKSKDGQECEKNATPVTEIDLERPVIPLQKSRLEVDLKCTKSKKHKKREKAVGDSHRTMSLIEFQKEIPIAQATPVLPTSQPSESQPSSSIILSSHIPLFTSINGQDMERAEGEPMRSPIFGPYRWIRTQESESVILLVTGISKYVWMDHLSSLFRRFGDATFALVALTTQADRACLCMFTDVHKAKLAAAMCNGHEIVDAQGHPVVLTTAFACVPLQYELL